MTENYMFSVFTLVDHRNVFSRDVIKNWTSNWLQLPGRKTIGE